MYLYWIDETMFLSFWLWFVWAHALCDRETTLGGRSRIGTTTTKQLPSEPCAMCIENNNWLRIRDDYRFIHKMMRRRTNARPYFNAMNKFNSVYNSMNKMKENRISKWKDAIESKWSVCHTRCHLALNLWLHRNLFTFKTETNSAKTIWIVYLLRRERRRERTGDWCERMQIQFGC